MDDTTSVKIVCKMCGKEFEYYRKSNKGVLPNYCSNDCRILAQKEAAKRYIEKAKDKKAAKSKMKKVLAENVNELLNSPQKIVREHIATSMIINSKIEEPVVETIETVGYVREEMPRADELTMRVLDFAMRLGQLKYEGHELLNELSKMTSEYDKQDESFLHLIEAMDKVTIEQMQEIWKKEADARTNRRDTKTLYKIINSMIYNIPQHPHQYAREAIERKKIIDEKYSKKFLTTLDNEKQNNSNEESTK